MPTTGETCQRTAVYHSTCPHGHARTIALAQGEVFPPCGEKMASGQCAAAVAWQIGPASPAQKP